MQVAPSSRAGGPPADELLPPPDEWPLCRHVPDELLLPMQVADMLQLPFADASFDVVVDKGTLDVLVVDADSLWDPQPSTKQRMFQAIDEVHRWGSGAAFVRQSHWCVQPDRFRHLKMITCRGMPHR